MSIFFGTGVCNETFPTYGDNPDEHARVWVQPSREPEKGIVSVNVERQGKPGTGTRCEGATAYLNREHVRDLIDTLQRLLDNAGPEQVAEPDCDYIIDNDGDYWVRTAYGLWRSAGSLDYARDYAEGSAPGEGARFDTVLSYAPLRPFKVELRQVEVELDRVPA